MSLYNSMLFLEGNSLYIYKVLKKQIPLSQQFHFKECDLRKSSDISHPKCKNVHCKTVFFLKILLFIHERHRGRDIGRGRSEQEPDVGLDPRTPGSWPNPREDTQPLSHPGAPMIQAYMPGSFLWNTRLFLTPFQFCSSYYEQSFFIIKSKNHDNKRQRQKVLHWSITGFWPNNYLKKKSKFIQ